MQKIVKKIMYWLPRVFCVLLAIVMSYFALTVINDGGTLWDTTLNLFAHFIPIAIFVFILVFVWEWEWVAILYIVFASMILIWKWELFPSNSFLVSSGLLFFAGLLFLANWISIKKFKKSN